MNNARKLLYASAAALAVVACIVAAATISYLRREAVRDQSLATENLARSVKQTVDAMVANIDYVLQVSSDEIEHQIATGNADPAAITRYLARQQERFPHIDLLRATNAQGEVIYGKGVDPAQRASLAQRNYFQRLRDAPSLGMVIAEPIVGKISQKWIWLMARRVDAPDGSFAGVVYASIFIDELVKLFEQFRMPHGSVMALRDQAMKVVARTTFNHATPLPIGDNRLSLPLQEALERNSREGTYESDASAADGVDRLFSYRRSDKYGFTILVGLPAGVVAAQWRPQAAIVLGSLGAFLTGLLFFVALTRRRWEQQSLAQSLASRERERAFLKSLIHTIPDMVWLKDLEGRYLACNREVERVLGHPEPEILGRTAYDFVARDAADDIRSNDRAVVAAGRPMVNEEWITYAPDGRRALLLTTKTPMRAADGTLVGVLGVAHDITELRAAETELQRLNAELEHRVAERTEALRSANRQLLDTQFAMDSVGIGIAWADFETARFIHANRHSAELLEYSIEELLDLRVFDIYPHFPPETYGQIRERVRQEGHVRIESEQKAKSGRLIPVEVTIYFSPGGDGTPPKLIAFTADITQRRESAQALLKAKTDAETANVAKSAFIANMSHEIRTPLNAILGLNHLIRGDNLTDTQKQRLDKMSVAGQHLLSIINDILDLSKIEAGGLELESNDFHLSTVLDNVASIIRDSAESKGLALHVDPDGVPQWLRGDGTRLRQALLNFAGNAVKFTEEGRIELRALLLGDQEEELLVRFEVRDTGLGLSPEQQARLFRPFEQADNSTSRKFGGTGLGLALTKRLVELMQGSVGVESAPGSGSVFWFTVPLQRGHGPVPQEPTISALAAAEVQLRARHRGARILLAEDNRINIEVIQEILHAAELDVTVAVDGREAVSAATRAVYDLILMDMQMPVLNGLDATREIRADPRHAATPIIALTANAFAEDRRACLNAGMNGVLTKPVDPEELYGVLIQWLEGATRR